jgi:hypothetical protein
VRTAYIGHVEGSLFNEATYGASISVPAKSNHSCLFVAIYEEYMVPVEAMGKEERPVRKIASFQLEILDGFLRCSIKLKYTE